MRQVTLLIGRQSYTMKTALSDGDLKDAQELVNEVMRETGPAGEQEIRLALTCMVLANRLAVSSRRLDRIASQPQGESVREEETETGDNELVIGDSEQVTEDSELVIGDSEQVTEDSEPVIGDSEQVTEDSEPVIGGGEQATDDGELIISEDYL